MIKNMDKTTIIKICAIAIPTICVLTIGGKIFSKELKRRKAAKAVLEPKYDELLRYIEYGVHDTKVSYSLEEITKDQYEEKMAEYTERLANLKLSYQYDFKNFKL